MPTPQDTNRIQSIDIDTALIIGYKTCNLRQRALELAENVGVYAINNIRPRNEDFTFAQTFGMTTSPAIFVHYIGCTTFYLIGGFDDIQEAVNEQLIQRNGASTPVAA